MFLYESKEQQMGSVIHFLPLQAPASTKSLRRLAKDATAGAREVSEELVAAIVDMETAIAAIEQNLSSSSDQANTLCRLSEIRHSIENARSQLQRPLEIIRNTSQLLDISPE
jgi:hypothetical protein